MLLRRRGALFHRDPVGAVHGVVGSGVCAADDGSGRIRKDEDGGHVAETPTTSALGVINAPTNVDASVLYYDSVLLRQLSVARTLLIIVASPALFKRK